MLMVVEKVMMGIAKGTIMAVQAVFEIHIQKVMVFDGYYGKK